MGTVGTQATTKNVSNGATRVKEVWREVKSTDRTERRLQEPVGAGAGAAGSRALGAGVRLGSSSGAAARGVWTGALRLMISLQRYLSAPWLARHPIEHGAYRRSINGGRPLLASAPFITPHPIVMSGVRVPGHGWRALRRRQMRAGHAVPHGQELEEEEGEVQPSPLRPPALPSSAFTHRHAGRTGRSPASWP